MSSPDSRLAICDQEAFYPFRSLVKGPLKDHNELPQIERFLRTVVLHDELVMELEPHAYHPSMDEVEWTDEEIAAGVRPVIVAYGPTIEEYGLFSEIDRAELGSGSTLPAPLLEMVARFSNAEAGNPFYKAHLDYLRRLIDNVNRGGSVLCEGGIGQAAFEKATEFPAALFRRLDADWPKYAERLQAGRFGLLLPPVLAIVLHRCARRDAIPRVVQDLRDEWATPRRRVWRAIDDLKRARSLKEVNEIEGELAQATELFSPATKKEGVSPVRALWGLSTSAAAGAVTATFSGIGLFATVATKLSTGVIDAFRSFVDTMRPWRGAFDLAQRVSREAASVEPTPELLSRFLTEAEKKALGY